MAKEYINWKKMGFTWIWDPGSSLEVFDNIGSITHYLLILIMSQTSFSLYLYN